MTAMAPRRAFLRGLITLPLVGGAVELIGNPRAVATPITYQLMFEYEQWLAWETARIHGEMYYSHNEMEVGCLKQNAASEMAAFLHKVKCVPGLPPRDYDRLALSNSARWHMGTPQSPPPSTRAALVLATVGVDWKAPYR